MISIVVPVYNTEKYIHNCVDSILGQSCADFELILVDDGSPDNCGAICDEYAAKDARVRVVHQKNGGPSVARNAGIDAATGEYVALVDSDDTIEPTTIEDLVSVIEKCEPDCIDFGFRQIFKSGRIYYSVNSIEKDVLLNEKYIREWILPPMLNLRKDDDHFIENYACNKVFKRAVLEEHQIRFDHTRRVWEDRPFIVTFLRYCRTYYSMSGHYYNYMETDGSLSRRFTLEFLDNIIKNYNLYKQLFGKEFVFDTQYVYRYWSRAVEKNVKWGLLSGSKDGSVEEKVREVLANKQVVEWFEKRKAETLSERYISRCLIGGNPDKAIEKLKAQARKEQAQANYSPLKKRIIRIIRRVIPRAFL